LRYSVRRMYKEDLDQVDEIDREAFPTQWPPANYKQELQNKIAYYIVCCDNLKTIEPPPPVHERKHPDIRSLLMPWKKQHTAIPPEVPAPQLLVAGFSGVWMLADEAHITNLAVRGSYRGKGLGEYLLIATYDLAQSLNAIFMTLEVRASNIVAQGLYNKYGFVEMGVRKGYYLDNREDAIIMTTDLLVHNEYKERIEKLRQSLSKKLESQSSV
jgi:[ribosomal protein S18]-alanine N-acetyltransferase